LQGDWSSDVCSSDLHPLMNEVIAGFKEVVTKAKPNASYFERHAEGRPEQYGTAVLATIAANPDLLSPITTPITKLTVEQARGRKIGRASCRERVQME